MGLLGFLGRTALVLIFVVAGINKFQDISGTVSFMKDHGINQYTKELAYAAAALEVLCGFFVIVGIQQQFFALLLVAFLLPTTYIFHFNYTDPVQAIMILKNLSIAGGLLVLADQRSPSKIKVN
eukprot:TRINITY_DN6765_c0_g1_i1.p1 TRINITY_DN6765_c0_g1~~TRINITY_DN6765_c0_g1_i1.p1  ORF type:complete len:124 (+),score=28.69 TRINITY_DN6765_c0_g1_i1:143-514(+)